MSPAELEAAADSIAAALRLIPQPPFDHPLALAITEARHRLHATQTALRDAARWGWISEAVERPPVAGTRAIVRQRLRVVGGTEA